MTAIKILRKLTMGAALALFFVVTPASAQETPPTRPVPEAQRDGQSYAMGVEMLRNLKRQGSAFNLDMVIRGMKDEAEGNKLIMSEQSLKTFMSMVVSEARRKKAVGRLTAGNNNRKEGEDFLAGNKTKEGVVALPSGLQYKIIKAGDGRKPTDADTVECLLRGTHIDGTEFDTSYRSGQPQTFKVSETIPGWKEALKLMPVGSKWQLFIPSVLAYGQRGSGHIGPYETIIYEIELVGIK